MAESAVTCLLNNFSTWVQREQNLLGGLGIEVKNIIDELEHMRAFLRVVDSKEHNDPQLEVWTRQVRDIAYDIEDVLDQYKLQIANHGTNGFSARIKKIYGLIKGLKSRRQTASQIQAIKSRVVNASQSYLTYKNKYPIMDQDETCHDGRGDALLLEDADVVGIEDPKKQLIQWIQSTEGGLKVISVVGMGGIGKTTLVKKVNDDESLVDNFDHRVWITVSESYKIEDLLERMINLVVDDVNLAMPPKCLEFKNADEMRDFVYKFLQDKTYLVVLDDIWRIDAWEAIKYAFPRSMTSGRGCIIITTRFNSIANAASCDTQSHVFNLKPLSVEDSKLLFYKKVFRGNSCPLYLEKISESILKKCEGLPLAIVVIGGILATKNNNIEEWEMFNHNIGDELERDNLKRLRKIISLSFYDLPYYLKSCFLYLSIFPEDEQIYKCRLVQLWTAEGFVQEKQGKTVEEVAEGYLNELVNRSLIQVMNMCIDGSLAFFHIHDIVRKYIILKSRHEFFIANEGGDVRRTDKIRRIALDASSNTIPESYNIDHIRSIMWFGSKDPSCVEKLHKVILDRRCRLLKVLDLERAPLESIPREVFKVYHLKFLSLRGTKVKLIPRSIKYLVNLETLDLNDTEVTQLPTEVVKLKKLRHLLGGLYPIRGLRCPNDIGSMSSLQTLKVLTANEDVGGVNTTVIEIGMLTQLRILGLTNIQRKDGKDLCSSLSKLNSLRDLSLSSVQDEVIDLEHPMSTTSSFPFLHRLSLIGCIETIPQWTRSLVGLIKLNLIGCRLRGDQDPLERIQCLPNLEFLVMESAYKGNALIFRAGRFQRLKRLVLSVLQNLRWMKVEEGCMPHLQELFIVNCKLMAMPEGLQHLVHLQSVEFREMSEEFATRVMDQKRKGKEWELGHVHKVVIRSLVIDEQTGGRSIKTY